MALAATSDIIRWTKMAPIVDSYNEEVEFESEDDLYYIYIEHSLKNCNSIVLNGETYPLIDSSHYIDDSDEWDELYGNPMIFDEDADNNLPFMIIHSSFDEEYILFFVYGSVELESLSIQGGKHYQ